jgi:lactoylglutathione lyase
MPNLYTDDIEKSVAFYRDLLGGTQTFRFPADGSATHVGLRLGDATIALSSRDVVEGVGLPAPTDGHPLELVIWCESTDDMVAAPRERPSWLTRAVATSRDTVAPMWPTPTAIGLRW